MPRYLCLLSFTEKGVQNFRDSATRAEAFRAAVESAGGQVDGQYWALGDFDACVVFEAPDEETAAGLLLALGAQGYVRTRTQRLYDQREFGGVVAKAQRAPAQ